MSVQTAEVHVGMKEEATLHKSGMFWNVLANGDEDDDNNDNSNYYYFGAILDVCMMVFTHCYSNYHAVCARQTLHVL